MAIPTPNHPPTPVPTGTDVTIDGPSDLGAKIVRRLAEQHGPADDGLGKLDASRLKITRSEKRSVLPEDLKFVWGATFVSPGGRWAVTALTFRLSFLPFPFLSLPRSLTYARPWSARSLRSLARRPTTCSSSTTTPPAAGSTQKSSRTDRCSWTRRARVCIMRRRECRRGDGGWA